MSTFSPIVIRTASAVDTAAVERLAALDSSYAPRGDVLLAFEGAELRAALSVSSGHAVADPFERTAEVVELLRARAVQRSRPAPRAPRRRLRPVLA